MVLPGRVPRRIAPSEMAPWFPIVPRDPHRTRHPRPPRVILAAAGNQSPIPRAPRPTRNPRPPPSSSPRRGSRAPSPLLPVPPGTRGAHPASFSPQRESRALMMGRDGYASRGASDGQAGIPPAPFFQTRIRLNSGKGSVFRCGENYHGLIKATPGNENGLFS